MAEEWSRPGRTLTQVKVRAAAIETVTGLVMILFPHVLIRLLFDADASGAGIVAAASPAFH